MISVNTLEHMQRQKQANACQTVTSHKTGWVVAGVGAGRIETNTYFPKWKMIQILIHRLITNY